MRNLILGVMLLTGALQADLDAISYSDRAHDEALCERYIKYNDEILIRVKGHITGGAVVSTIDMSLTKFIFNLKEQKKVCSRVSPDKISEIDNDITNVERYKKTLPLPSRGLDFMPYPKNDLNECELLRVYMNFKTEILNTNANPWDYDTEIRKIIHAVKWNCRELSLDTYFRLIEDYKFLRDYFNNDYLNDEYFTDEKNKAKTICEEGYLTSSPVGQVFTNIDYISAEMYLNEVLFFSYEKKRACSKAFITPYGLDENIAYFETLRKKLNEDKK